MSDLEALAMVIADQRQEIERLNVDLATEYNRATRFETQFDQAREALTEGIHARNEYRAEIAYLNGELQGFINAMSGEDVICLEEPPFGSIVECTNCGSRHFKFVNAKGDGSRTWITQDNGSIWTWESIRDDVCTEGELKLVYRG